MLPAILLRKCGVDHLSDTLSPMPRALMTVHSSAGMVTAPHALAAQSGARILAEGGNAIEATLATAATLCVVYPHMTGLGGDSFWLIAEADAAPLTIDGAGRTGTNVTAALYADLGL